MATAPRLRGKQTRWTACRCEATQSVSSWIAYLTVLVMTTNGDDREPAGFPAGGPSTLPVDDQSEPAAL